MRTPSSRISVLWSNSRFEKLVQCHKSEGKVVDVFSAALHDFNQEFNEAFMEQAVIPDDQEPSMQTSVGHLTEAQKSMFLPIQQRYQSIASRGKHHVGRFPLWKVSAKIDEQHNCYQKCRSRDLPDSAWLDLQAYRDNAVFDLADEGIDKYCANIMLTKRPTTKEQKFSTKADKNAAKINLKNSSSNQDPQSAQVPSDIQMHQEKQRQLYRLSIDFRSVNKATLNDCTIQLPTLQSIENAFQGCLISTFDISNAFYNIELEPYSTRFFNFFVRSEIWCHMRLPQGWSAAPKFCSDAIQATFTKAVLKEFLDTKSEHSLWPVSYIICG